MKTAKSVELPSRCMIRALRSFGARSLQLTSYPFLAGWTIGAVVMSIEAAMVPADAIAKQERSLLSEEIRLH